MFDPDPSHQNYTQRVGMHAQGRDVWRLLVTDLGADIGSRRWLVGFTSLMVAVTALVVIGRWSPYVGADRPLTPHENASPESVAHAANRDQPAETALGDQTLETPIIRDVALDSGHPPSRQMAEAPHSENAAAGDQAVLENRAPGDKDTESAPPIEAGPKQITTVVTVHSGATMIDLLTSQGIDRNDAHLAIRALKKAYDPRRLRVGQKLKLVSQESEVLGAGAEIVSLDIRTGFNTYVQLLGHGDRAYEARAYEAEITTKRDAAAGTIRDSLYLSAARADLSAQTIVRLMRIYAFAIDFQREVWSGDRFAVIYETETLVDAISGKAETRQGDIIAAEMTLRGKPITLVRFTPSEGEGAGRADYFHPDGASSRRLLLRTPIDGARLTSRFGSRKHPVLGFTRMHNGVDFGAPTGTPIMASGDGVVERANRFGSYGNYIRIRHPRGFKTAYAHLSRYARGIKAGKRVKQGDTIGYVGATGRVTGAHLHYEVYQGKKRINPMSLRLPTGFLLSGKTKMEFDAHAGPIYAQLTRLSKGSQDKASGPQLVRSSDED